MTEIKLSKRAKEILDLATEEARRFGSLTIRSEHILLGLARSHDAIAAQVLMLVGVTLDEDRIRDEIRKIAKPDVPSQTGTVSGESHQVTDLPLRLTERTTLAMARAAKLAIEMDAKAIGTEHVLLALLTDAQGTAVTALKDAGVVVDMPKLKQAVRAIHGFGTGLASPENLERWRKARESQMVRTSDPKIVRETSELLPFTPTDDQIREWREDALLVVSTRPSEEVLRKLVTSVFGVLEHVRASPKKTYETGPVTEGSVTASASGFPGNVRAVSPGENPEMEPLATAPITTLNARELAEIVSKDHRAARCDKSAIHDIRALLLMLLRHVTEVGDVKEVEPRQSDPQSIASLREIAVSGLRQDTGLAAIAALNTLCERLRAAEEAPQLKLARQTLRNVHSWFSDTSPNRTAASIHKEVRTALGLP